MEENKIFTTQELAKYLKLNEKTILKMAQNGHLPGVKIGNQWRFHLKAIDNFLLRDISRAPAEELESVIKSETEIIFLSRLTNPNLIELDCRAANIEMVIERLATIAYREGLTSSKDMLLNELKKREEILSTAVGNSVAIPHPRHPSAELFTEAKVVILLAKGEIAYDGPDGRPVHIFFMPCAPDEHTHIRLLAVISKLFHMPSIIEEMMQAETKEQIIQILLRFDRDHVYAGSRI